MKEEWASPASFVQIVQLDDTLFCFRNLDAVTPVALHSRIDKSFILMSSADCQVVVLEKVLWCVFGIEQLECDLVPHYGVSYHRFVVVGFFGFFLRKL